MESIFAVIILLLIAFGILVVSKSDASGSEKIMLMLMICVGGVIGGAIIVGLIMTSPVLAIVAVLFVSVFLGVFCQELYNDAVAKKKFGKTNNSAGTVSSASADEVVKIFADIKAGDEVNFGKYRWKVVTVKDDKAMLVTDKVVAKTEFHKIDESITWQDCTLRKNLNGSFLKSSFGEGERSLILTTTLDNCNMTSNGQKSLPKTEDKVFIWSYKEAERYAKKFKCFPPSDHEAKRCWTRTTENTWAYTYDCENGTRDIYFDTS